MLMLLCTDFISKYFSAKSSLQWIKDYKLVEWGTRGLFNEYLEMGKYTLY